MLLFGSTTLMMSSMEEMTVGSVEDDQNWDIQANVLFGGEDEVIQWADDKSGYHERIITFPANPVNDSRVISANGTEVLSTESSALIQLDLKEGKTPKQVFRLIDSNRRRSEPLPRMGDRRNPDSRVRPPPRPLRLLELLREMSRTVYFHRSDLAKIVGWKRQPF